MLIQELFSRLNGNSKSAREFQFEKAREKILHFYLVKSTNMIAIHVIYTVDWLFFTDVNQALLYAQPMAIMGMELAAPYRNYMPVLTNKWVENVTSLDVDAARRFVYWT